MLSTENQPKATSTPKKSPAKCNKQITLTMTDDMDFYRQQTLPLPSFSHVVKVSLANGESAAVWGMVSYYGNILQEKILLRFI